MSSGLAMLSSEKPMRSDFLIIVSQSDLEQIHRNADSTLKNFFNPNLMKTNFFFISAPNSKVDNFDSVNRFGFLAFYEF